MPGSPSTRAESTGAARAIASATSLRLLTRIEDDERPASLLQVVAGGQSRLAAADDHRLETLDRLSHHCCLLQLTLSTVGAGVTRASRRSTNFERAAHGWF